MVVAAVPAECKFLLSPSMSQIWEVVAADPSIVWILMDPLLATLRPDTMLTFFAAAVQKATSLANAPTHHLAAASLESASTVARLDTTRPTAPILASSASSPVPATPAVSTDMLHATALPTPRSASFAIRKATRLLSVRSVALSTGLVSLSSRLRKPGLSSSMRPRRRIWTASAPASRLTPAPSSMTSRFPTSSLPFGRIDFLSTSSLSSKTLLST